MRHRALLGRQFGQFVMEDFDISRAPRGVLAAQRLVHSVAKQGDLAERHYLELKSTLDLSTKADKEKIAKFILGAGNRMPTVAAVAFEGCAAMVIGVAQGSITGIPPVEMMEIAKVVQQFVGASGPTWDIVWVPVEGSADQVLVIVVDPPQPGQGPFPCRSSGQSLTSGRIYIRVEGETREANADEVDLLVQRGLGVGRPDVDFAFDVIGAVAPIALNESSTIEEYLRVHRARLLGGLPKHQPPRPAGSSVVSNARQGISSDTISEVARSALARAMLVPEDRTETEFEEIIDHWEDQFRAAWDSAAWGVVASQLTPIVVKLRNRSTTFLHDVEVRLHLEGEVVAANYVDPDSVRNFSDLDLPAPPRPWGPRESTHRIVPYADILRPPPIPRLERPPTITFQMGGTVELHLRVGELRPLGSYQSENALLVLVATKENLGSIRGRWELTARDHNDVYRGEIEVLLAPTIDATSAVRRVLGLDPS